MPDKYNSKHQGWYDIASKVSYKNYTQVNRINEGKINDEPHGRREQNKSTE